MSNPNEDFAFEMEFAILTNDSDRAHVALLHRFPVIRPVDIALFGGWDEAAMMTEILGHPGDSDRHGNRL